jgi:hypothetical protein
MLTLEEFAAKCLWNEHICLCGHISEHEGMKHFRKTLGRIKRGDLGLKPRTEWTAMVERWYREEKSGNSL